MKGAKKAGDKAEDVGEAAWDKTKKGAAVTADKAEDVGQATANVPGSRRRCSRQGRGRWRSHRERRKEGWP